MRPVNPVPVPYFVIGEDFQIFDCSEVARSLFRVTARTVDFLDLVDEESRNKARNGVHPHSPQDGLEINLLTADGEIGLFEVYHRWDAEGRGHVVCLPKDRELQPVMRLMQQLREEIQVLELTPPAAGRRRAGAGDTAMHLSTIRDLLRVVRPVLQEAGKGFYVQLIEEELDDLEESLRP